MTPPVELVLRSVEVSDAIASCEVVACVALTLVVLRFVVVAFVARRLMNVEVAVVVAVKYAPTTSPTTESFAYGDEVPIPRLLLRKTRPVPEVIDVPSKYVSPLVVCAVALVPPRLMGSVPVVSPSAIPSDDVAVHVGRPVV